MCMVGWIGGGGGARKVYDAETLAESIVHYCRGAGWIGGGWGFWLLACCLLVWRYGVGQYGFHVLLIFCHSVSRVYLRLFSI